MSDTMRGLKRYLGALALTMMATLPACTTYEAYQKCGFGGCPGDAGITADVRARFNRHAVLQPPNLLSVQTLDHVVYLNGLVDTDLEREIAESVAREAPGVRRVVNSIGISGNR
jgi:osmotically-inducible protein OsmY